jgi:hypothetical protein
MTDQPSTAFLALDFATYIVENFSHDPAVAERASNALASARAAGLPVRTSSRRLRRPLSDRGCASHRVATALLARPGPPRLVAGCR